jgi:hypothetical protein
MTIAKSSSFSNHFNYIGIKMPSHHYPHHLHTNHYVVIKMIMKSPDDIFFPYGCQKDEIQSIK